VKVSDVMTHTPVTVSARTYVPAQTLTQSALQAALGNSNMNVAPVPARASVQILPP
jgi:hypothetical protein